AVAPRNPPALPRERFAGHAGAGRRRMATAAKLAGDGIDIDLVTFGTQADAGQFRFNFFKHTGDDDGLDGPDMINQTFRVIGLSARAVKINLLQPEPGDPVVGGEAEFAVNVLE